MKYECAVSELIVRRIQGLGVLAHGVGGSREDELIRSGRSSDRLSHESDRCTRICQFWKTLFVCSCRCLNRGRKVE